MTRVATTDAVANGDVEELTPEQLAAQWEEEKPPAAGPLANAASSAVVIAVGLGALILSRAVDDPALSEEILEATATELGRR